jgi:hypothetical protein
MDEQSVLARQTTQSQYGPAFWRVGDSVCCERDVPCVAISVLLGRAYYRSSDVNFGRLAIYRELETVLGDLTHQECGV